MNPTFLFLARTVGLARGLGGTRAADYGAADSGAGSPQGFGEAEFVSAAIQHKVARSAIEGLRLQGLALSAQGLAALKDSSLKSALRAALAATEATALSQEFARRGIASFVLKGPAASLQHYGTINTREFYDLDMVVNLQSAATVMPILAARGFYPEDAEIAAAEHDSGRPGGLEKPGPLEQRSHHLVFYSPSMPIRIELHDRNGWEGEPFGHDSLDAVLKRSVLLETTLGDSAIAFNAPGLADHAVLLIAHGAQHAWCLLHWLLDAAVIIGREDPVFQKEFAERICALGVERQLAVAVKLVQRLYHCRPSLAVANIVENQNYCPDRAVEYAYARLEKGGKDMSRFLNILAMPFVFLAPQVKGFRKQCKIVVAPFKIPHKDIEALKVPKGLMFIHVLARPFFVISRRIRARRKADEK